MAERGFGGRYGFFNALFAAYVQLARKCAAAQRFDFRLERRQAADVAACEHEIRTGFRQCSRHVLAESSTGTRYERDAPAEIEKTIAHEALSGVRMIFIKLGS